MEASDIILRLHLENNVGILMKNAQKNSKACSVTQQTRMVMVFV
jgi:hypothetical protein